MSRIKLVGGSVLALVSGVYFGNTYAAGNKQQLDSAIKAPGTKFNSLAATYDQKISSTEESFGLLKIRENFIGKHATGRVLETCCGTGRNTAFYNFDKIEELVLVDSSVEMLQEAQKKFPSSALSKIRSIQATNLTQFPDNKFDTVIDTFGLCSLENPSEYLMEIKRVVKPGGKVLFLEHGRNESGWWRVLINTWLDLRAHSHETYWGCMWNREIYKLIETAGFTVIKKTVHHYGTCTEVLATK